jgi:peptidoglycan hydrolase-like protein with peptidoglycan-binding domain
MHMERCRSVLALTVAGLLLAGPAFAQSSAPSGADAPKSQDPAKPADSSSPSEGAKAGREHVKAAQQALKEKGYDPGTIDGVMGPKTQAALKDFQKAQGLQETGRLDGETMAKLGVEGRTGQTDSSSPAASPQTTPGPAQDTQSPTSKPQR